MSLTLYKTHTISIKQFTANSLRKDVIMFKGVGTALITPFNENGIDLTSYEKLIEFEIKNGVEALIVCGTTGEPATMTKDEKNSVISTALEIINKRVPAIVGTGANSTAIAIENSIEAEKMGADGLLVVTPYYNKCTQKGLIAHYKAIAEKVNSPIFLYNVPGRTGVNILPQTVKELSGVKNIVAIKEASGNMAQVMEIARLIEGTGMSLYSGDDALTLPMLALGAKGVISVASNVIPSVMSKIVSLYQNGDVEKSRELHFKYLPLMNALFVETNPIPVKYAASKLGLCKNILRMPLTSIEEANATKLDLVMREVGIID